MKQKNAMVWILVLLVAGAAWATDYTWIGASGGDWSVAGSWNPGGGPPLAADSASFTGTVNKTVDIVTGNQAVSNITVTGSAAWYWDADNLASHNTLTLGAGNLNYNGSNTLATLSSFNAVLAGSGGLRVNSGVLRIGDRNVHSNSFSGGIEVNGGVLGGGHYINYENANPSDFGTGPITIGSASPGSNDATLLLHSGLSCTNPVTIRAGNSGVARLGRWNQGPAGAPSAALSGSITLQKDLTIVNDESGVGSAVGGREQFYPLYLSGPMTGSGNVTKEGVGNVYLQGTNSYTGTTTFRGGTVYIAGTNNSNTGNFTVVYGALIAQTNESLGNLANTVTLGANGTFGEFGCYRASGSSVIVPFSRSITLAGNGGILSARGYFPRWQMDGVISGSGRLILAPGGDRNSRHYLNGNNLHTGGMIVNNGHVDITSGPATNNTVYGSGDIWVLRAGNLYVRGLNNIGAGAKVRIEYPGALSILAQYMPDITTNSDGIIGFGLTTESAINDRLASATPLGNGTLWLGTTPDADCIFTGSSLAALVANDPTHTYQLGLNGYGTRKLVMNTPVVAGALKDLGGNPHNVAIGGIRVDLNDDNPFTGTLTVQSGASCYGYLPDATGNPFGTNTGALVLQGAKTGSYNEKFQVVNSTSASRSLSKGAVSFDGSVGPFSIDGNAVTPTWTTTVAVASLNRISRSTLSIDAYRKTLGDVERMTVSGGIPSTNGMVAPYMWNGVDGVFLDYGVNGFTNAPFTLLTLTGSTATDIVSVAGSAVPAGGAKVYALKSSGALTGETLTNAGGGLILTGANINHFAPLDFGTNEAVFLVTALNTLSNTVTCSGGLTKSGAGQLDLRADNVGKLTGGIFIQQGTLTWTNWVHLGGVANTITMNGGTLYGGVATNDIVLGNLGGTLQLGTYAGNISGSGRLSLGLALSESTLKGTNNTYSGGTWINQFATVDAASSLGASGTVTLASYGHESGNARGVLTLKGAGNLTTAHRLILNSFNSTVLFQSAAPVVGSIEGNGTISFGAGSTPYTLRVGGNNRSTDYFGVIVESSAFSSTPRTLYFGTLVKEGTGTLTLWGESWYRGGTIISNGTLCVNNWMNPTGAVVVKPGATLDGIGSVGIVSNQGGTVKGNLYTAGLTQGAGAVLLVAMNGAGAGQYDVMTVNGPVDLTGSTLTLTLNFLPIPGQTFTILNNTSLSPITGQFACGRKVGGTYAGNGKTYWFAINYAGGTGNDIVLTCIPAGSMFTIR